MRESSYNTKRNRVSYTRLTCTLVDGCSCDNYYYCFCSTIIIIATIIIIMTIIIVMIQCFDDDRWGTTTINRSLHGHGPPSCACAYRWGKNRVCGGIPESGDLFFPPVAQGRVVRPGCNALSSAPLSLPPPPTHTTRYLYNITLLLCRLTNPFDEWLSAARIEGTRRGRLLGSLGVVFLYAVGPSVVFSVSFPPP